MVRDYKRARMVALGFEKPPDDTSGFKEAFGGEIRFSGIEGVAGMAMQFFEQSVDEPDELSAQRAALMLFDDYRKDKESALRKFRHLIGFVQKRKADEAVSFLRRNPCADWLSSIFIDSSDTDALREQLASLDDDSRKLLNDEFRAERERLVEFGELLDGFITATE